MINYFGKNIILQGTNISPIKFDFEQLKNIIIGNWRSLY